MSPASAHQTTTETTIHPPGGSTITAFEYQQHIQIVCSITENSDIVDTLWTIHTASDLDNGKIYVCTATEMHHNVMYTCH